jgi:hypothetical protein
MQGAPGNLHEARVVRTDVLCRNCGHAIGNHRDQLPPDGRACKAKDCNCTWVFDSGHGTREPRIRKPLSEFV